MSSMAEQSARMFLPPRLVRSRLKDREVSERKQVADVVDLVADEGPGSGSRCGETAASDGCGGSGFYNPNHEL